jgi:hypothetical protein
MNMTTGGLVFALMLVTAVPGSAQRYPRWFLYPDQIQCPGFTIGAAPKEYYSDSSGGQAFVAAVENAVRASEVTLEGAKAYGATDEWTIAVSSTVVETFDGSAVKGLRKSYKPIEIRDVNDMTIVLAAQGGCSLPGPLSEIMPMPTVPPPWIAALPQDKSFVYALGMSEPSYYESSSWLEAEKHARLELAKSISSQHTAISHNQTASSGETSYDEVNDERLSVTLRGTSVVARWIDPGTRLFAVLLKMPKQ